MGPEVAVRYESSLDAIDALDAKMLTYSPVLTMLQVLFLAVNHQSKPQLPYITSHYHSNHKSLQQHQTLNDT